MEGYELNEVVEAIARIERKLEASNGLPRMVITVAGSILAAAIIGAWGFAWSIDDRVKTIETTYAKITEVQVVRDWVREFLQMTPGEISNQLRDHEHRIRILEGRK